MHILSDCPLRTTENYIVCQPCHWCLRPCADQSDARCAQIFHFSGQRVLQKGCSTSYGAMCGTSPGGDGLIRKHGDLFGVAYARRELDCKPPLCAPELRVPLPVLKSKGENLPSFLLLDSFSSSSPGQSYGL